MNKHENILIIASDADKTVTQTKNNKIVNVPVKILPKNLPKNTNDTEFKYYLDTLR